MSSAPGRDTSAMNHPNWMIPGAHESWRSQLHYESKNIENRRVLFAGDDFEKNMFVEYWRKSIDYANISLKD